MKKIVKNKYVVRALYSAVVFAFGVGIGYGVRPHVVEPLSATVPGYITHASTSGNTLESAATKSAQSDFATFWQVWNVLDENYAVPASTTITADDRIDGAILGLTQSYGDPYTTVFIKQGATDFKEQVSGQFEGIGAVLNQEGEYVVVQKTLEGSPAEHAGLRPGDRVTKANGTSLIGVDMQFAVQNIRGPKDTVVSLEVIREESGHIETLVIEVTRGMVAIQSVAAATADAVVSAVTNVAETVVNKVKAVFAATENTDSISPEQQAEIDAVAASADSLGKNLYIMRLAIFSESSPAQIKEELTEYVRSGKRDLIIDLRGNPGGILQVAEDFASYFLPKDAVVATEVFGKTGEKISYVSHGYTLLPENAERRIIILLDRNSASASEIFAAALRESGAAIIIGEQSYGKGSVQQMLDVNDHLTLKMTIARWYTPKGATIDKVGITPDVVVDMETSTSSDPIFERAVEHLLGV